MRRSRLSSFPSTQTWWRKKHRAPGEGARTAVFRLGSDGWCGACWPGSFPQSTEEPDSEQSHHRSGWYGIKLERRISLKGNGRREKHWDSEYLRPVVGISDREHGPGSVCAWRWRPPLDTIWEMGRGDRTAGKERHELQGQLQLGVLAAGTAPFTPGELGQQETSGLGGRVWPSWAGSWPAVLSCLQASPGGLCPRPEPSLTQAASGGRCGT